MAGTLDFLRAHFDALERETESWKKRHDAVMRQYDKADALAEAVAFGLFIHERIAKLLQSEDSVTVACAKQFVDVYEWWYAKASVLLSAVDESERQGFPVEESGQFRETHNAVAATMHGLSVLRTALADMDAGQFRPMKEVFDELRSCPRPASD
jgi:hypothetical protein